MSSLRSHLPSFNTTASKLAAGLILGSVVWAVTRTGLGALLLLVPADVLRGRVWQLLTYAFIETSPMGVIFGALILWSMGGELERGWGSRRTLFFALGVSVSAAACTVLGLRLLYPAATVVAFPGGNVMTTALWVAYGISYGSRITGFWGLRVTGYQFAGIGVGFVLLNAAFARSFLVVLPELIALALTVITIRFGGPQVWWLRLQNARLQRQLRGRAKHLRVIGKDRNHPSDSDRYLQ